MTPSPVRRFAAATVATAVLAGAFLVPAAIAAADDLADPAAQLEAPAAESIAPELAPDSPAPVEQPVEQPTAPPEDAEPVKEEPADQPVAQATAEDTRPTLAAAPAASAAPVASLTGEAFIAAGDTWVGTLAVDDATYVRIAALGSRFEITMTDSALTSRHGVAADGYLDLGLNTTVPNGDITVAIHNLASVPQEIPYVFGWDTSDIRAFASVGSGQPTLGISVFPRRGETELTASAVARIVDSVGGVQTVNLTGSAGYYHADVAGLAPGRYLVETDALVLGVHRFAARVVRVVAAETTPPTVTLTTSQPQAAGGWFPGAVDVTLSASDAGAGLNFLYWGLDTATLSYTSLPTTTFTVTGEGTHQVRYQADDLQGNTSALATRQINIDQTAPTATLNGLADGDEFEQDELVAIEYLCEDALSGIQSCVGDIGSGDFLDTSAPGAHTFRVTATDRAGNEQIIERGYTVSEPDTTDPVVDVDVPAVPASGWYLDEVTVRLSASDESGIRRIHYEYGTTQGVVIRDIEADTAEITFDRSQFYTLSYWAEDGAGNRSESRDLQLYVDSTAPWVNVSSPDEDELSILPNGHYAQNERVVIDFNCDDDASGIATCEGTTPDGELLPTGTPGTHELTIVATDVAGHRTEHVVSYTVDAAPAPAPGGTGGGAVAAAGGLASTGAQDVVPAIAVALLLLGAGAAIVTRRRVRTR